MLLYVIQLQFMWLVATSSAADVYTGINSFANKLYTAISPDEDIILSPFSVHSGLSVAYEGAAGDTSLSFQRSLNLPDPDSTARQYKTVMDTLNSARSVKLHVANKIYIMNGYTPKRNFRSMVQNYFSAEVENINFLHPQAADYINGWVKQKTQNKIDKLFQVHDFDYLTTAVLLNAIYFKGAWLKPFPKDYTHTRTFHVSQSKQIKCQMMIMEGVFDYIESAILNAKILRMKYEDERFAMILILPKERNGLKELEKQMLSVDITTLPENPIMLSVSLPKFKIETTLQMKKPLEQIGLANIFSNSANFSNMIENHDKLQIRKVVHKAFIEVNEEGSEAAAATGFEIVDRIINDKPTFTANHPFMFYITAKLGSEGSNNASIVLFMGKVVLPKYDD